MSFLCVYIKVCLPKPEACFYMHKCIFTHINAPWRIVWKKVTQKNNQPMLVKTCHRVRYLALFALLIHASNSVRNCSYLHHCALFRPAESPWMKPYHYGDASSFLTMTGMSRQAFLQFFDMLFADCHQQPNKGARSLLMDPTAQLGLYLFFVGSTMGIKHLHPQSVVELLQQCYLWWCENWRDIPWHNFKSN